MSIYWVTQQHRIKSTCEQSAQGSRVDGQKMIQSLLAYNMRQWSQVYFARLLIEVDLGIVGKNLHHLQHLRLTHSVYLFCFCQLTDADSLVSSGPIGDDCQGFVYLALHFLGDLDVSCWFRLNCLFYEPVRLLVVLTDVDFGHLVSHFFLHFFSPDLLAACLLLLLSPGSTHFQIP